MQIYLQDDPVRDGVFFAMGIVELIFFVVIGVVIKRLLPKRYKLA